MHRLQELFAAKSTSVALELYFVNFSIRATGAGVLWSFAVRPFQRYEAALKWT